MEKKTKDARKQLIKLDYLYVHKIRFAIYIVLILISYSVLIYNVLIYPTINNYLKMAFCPKLRAASVVLVFSEAVSYYFSDLSYC